MLKIERGDLIIDKDMTSDYYLSHGPLIVVNASYNEKSKIQDMTFYFTKMGHCIKYSYLPESIDELCKHFNIYRKGKLL